MKHIVFTRINFDDKELMSKYVKISKEVLIPALKSQTCKNFTLLILCKSEDEEYLRKELDFPFVRIGGNFVEYVIKNEINIQTRHDCDDWMAPNYIELIQNTYKENIDKKDKFLVQSQPLRLDYNTKKTIQIQKYHEKRCSMHLSLCQKNVTNHINERIHSKMFEITNHVIMLPGNPTQWVIHGDNKSVKNGRVRYEK
jgi:hypothetical protein